ncbi:MAG: Cysteinyl-tRNA synthetase [uncultured Thermomicrobiales bacterium]|uniref:Cysteine--tRNA ligase n=1 Tax=uncultured Thermomicrobiales bacterium TaxID=1645740 RepID=A0A6J4UPC2_9BACT|nr:MAG: Cysteinyl-tRNA synthetase [uncultured Thermomicrobiales bacterium]
MSSHPIATSRDTLPEIQLYDTLTRRVSPLRTIEPGVVRLYVCGVTVYDSAHIGHGLSAIIFDTIRRYLTYRGYVVRHAQNFTDIDDKIIARADREGIAPSDLTEQMIAQWHLDTAELNILPATVYPQATHELPAIIAMIQRLIERDAAYEVDGDVYYRVRSFDDYGKLSHRRIDDLMSGARIDVDERKADPLDFALWKAAKPGEPSWPSPFGHGRPGWHIECSAMCTTHLGDQIDIHGGGTDLIFPHHENEIAQSEAALGVEPFARYWVHNGLLQFSGEKMSKSLGNFVRIRELADQGLAMAFRLLVLQSHYRVPLTYTDDGLKGAANGLARLRAAAVPLAPDAAVGPGTTLDGMVSETRSRFHAAMSDDFNTPEAVAALFDLARQVNRARADGPDASFAAAQATFLELVGVLGLDLSEPAVSGGDSEPFIQLLVEVRDEVRKAKQWALADSIRDRLGALGVTVEDGPTGGTWRHG